MSASIKRVSIAAAALVALGLTAHAATFQDAQRDLSTYSDVEDMLTWEYVIAPDATWQYFLGREEPSPKLEWTGRDFGARDWQLGQAPFGFGEAEYSTSVAEMLEEGLSTMYIRHVVIIPDPLVYRWMRFEIDVDDGYVCYLNRLDEGRASGGPKSDTRMDHDAIASSRRSVERVPRAGIDFTDKVKTGENTVAIHALNYEGEETFVVAPQIRGWFAVNPERDRERFLAIKALLKGDANAQRRAYLEGLFLQRIGQAAEAIPFFAEAASLDPTAVEPWDRLLACHREAGSVAALEQGLRSEIEAGASNAHLLDTWARAFLEDLGGSVTELPALAPVCAQGAPGSFSADAFFAGSKLGAGEVIRLDSGSAEDRFHAAGKPETVNGDASTTVRSIVRERSNFAPTYRIPLPTGAYALKAAVLAAEPFELVLEGSRVECEAGTIELPVFVSDGFLELEMIPSVRTDMPAFESVELALLETASFRSSVEAMVAATNREDAYALQQLGEAQLAADEGRAAVLAFEEARALPRFSHDANLRLITMRDALLPEVASIASVEDLVVRRAGEAEKLLADFQAQAESDEALAIATYMEGRIFQLAGDFDQAIGFYEQLVFEGAPYPEPYIGMAECLRGVQLPEEACAILRDAIEAGVPASDDLLHLLLMMQVDDLKVDAWEMVAELRGYDVPDTLTVIPTSQFGAQRWEYSIKEPAATTWSRESFDTAAWDRGLGGLGAGNSVGALVRSHWYRTVTIFSRQPIALRSRPVLYPYFLANFDDAADIYLNGTLSQRIPNRTYGYILLPAREGKFSQGGNILGMYGVNSRDQGFIDAGVVEPVAELEWILTALENDGALRINCAGGEYTDAQGRHWTHDRIYSGYGAPLALEGDLPTVQGTEEQGLYQSQQLYTTRLDEDDNWYQVPVPNGAYSVTLHFAEIDPKITEAGQRVFTVKLEKTDVLPEYDIFASAGFATADAHTFDVNVTDGWMDIELLRLVIEELGRGGVEKHRGDPVISAIEIVQK